MREASKGGRDTSEEDLVLQVKIVNWYINSVL